jgi:integrase
MDLAAAEWRMPPENTKTGRAHIVPLVPEAVKILQAIAVMFGDKADALVFPGLKGPMSDATLAKAMRVDGGGSYTVHGLRSTFRDWAADHGFNNDWAEAALAHSISGQEGKTVAAYKRTTFFDQRRDKLMPAWSAFAMALHVGGTNV